MLLLIQFAIVAFVLTQITMWVLLPIAGPLGLVDRPGLHKTHRNATPLVGGVAMYLGFLVAYFLASVTDPVFETSAVIRFGIIGMVVTLGALDDKVALPVALRLPIQVIASAVLLSLLGREIQSLGSLLPAMTLNLGALALPFSVFAMVGAMNAMNMIDGLDGLAGGIALVTVGLLAVVAAVANESGLAQELVLLFGAIAAFWVLNVRGFGRSQARVFMGDAGSTFLGLSICYYLIEMSQGTASPILKPVTALWLFALPIGDTIAVILRRLQRGVSPFSAGHDHLHHLLLRFGLSVNQTAFLMIATHGLLCILALVGQYSEIPDAVMFAGFLVLTGMYFLILVRCDDPAVILDKLPAFLKERWPATPPLLILNVPSTLDPVAFAQALSDPALNGTVVQLRPLAAASEGPAPLHLLVQCNRLLSYRLLTRLFARVAGEDAVAPLTIRRYVSRSPKRDRRVNASPSIAGYGRDRRRHDRRIPHQEEPVQRLTQPV